MYAAFRAKTIISLAGEKAASSLAALDAPLERHSDAVIMARDGLVEAVESYSSFRARKDNTPLLDLGDATLVPGLINAHCHLELSHLQGQTVLGQGFVPWLLSLIPLAARPIVPDELLNILKVTVKDLSHCGTAHVGDVGSRNPALVAQAIEISGKDTGCVQCRLPGFASKTGTGTSFNPIFGAESRPRSSALPCLPVTVTHFLESFGFGPPLLPGALPPELAADGYCPPVAATLAPERYPHASVAGHALYSTSPAALAAAHAWCRANHRPFSMHLAEHPEEDVCLQHGNGALFELLSERILPAGWQAPGLAPTAFADSLGLLSRDTLAVHCVRCSSSDIALLRQCEAAVCLCPRSNAAIAVGSAPAEEMARAGVPLCLGTDSLASNHSLDLQEEMLAARYAWQFSPRAVLRMATVNGAEALKLNGPGGLGSLAPGRRLSFAVLREELAAGL